MNGKQDAKLKLMSGIETLQSASDLKVGVLSRIHTFVLRSSDRTSVGL